MNIHPNDRPEPDTWVQDGRTKPIHRFIQPTNWQLTPAMRAVRQQWFEKYRDDFSRGCSIRVAQFLVEAVLAKRTTCARRDLPLNNIEDHLKDIGVLRKTDAPSGAWYYFITPFARDWAEWILAHAEQIRDGSWPVVDQSPGDPPSQAHGRVDAPAESESRDQSQRGLPVVGEQPSRQERSDGGDHPFLLRVSDK